MLIFTAHYFCCSPRLTQIILVYPAISHSFLAFPSVTRCCSFRSIPSSSANFCASLTKKIIKKKNINQRVPSSPARLLSLQLNSLITKSHCRICVSVDIQYFYLCDLILSLIKFSALWLSLLSIIIKIIIITIYLIMFNFDLTTPKIN